MGYLRGRELKPTSMACKNETSLSARIARRSFRPALSSNVLSCFSNDVTDCLDRSSWAVRSSISRSLWRKTALRAPNSSSTRPCSSRRLVRLRVTDVGVRAGSSDACVFDALGIGYQHGHGPSDQPQIAYHSSLSFRAASTSASSLATDCRNESVLTSLCSRSRFCSFRTSILSFRCRS